jgi:acetyltransferase-like isoleucine patch superfamily enzyme
MNGTIAAAIKYLSRRLIQRVPSHRFRLAWYRHVLGWQIGDRATILMDQRLQMGRLRSPGTVSIGEGTVINEGCFLHTTGGLVIGADVSISAGASLITGTHDMNHPDFPDRYRPITIGDRAWIGARATVLGGVVVGEGAVVMAGAVVTRDIPPYAVAGGVPAQVVGQRRRDLAYRLDYRPLFE